MTVIRTLSSAWYSSVSLGQSVRALNLSHEDQFRIGSLDDGVQSQRFWECLEFRSASNFATRGKVGQEVKMFNRSPIFAKNPCGQTMWRNGNNMSPLSTDRLGQYSTPTVHKAVPLSRSGGRSAERPGGAAVSAPVTPQHGRSLTTRLGMSRRRNQPHEYVRSF